MTDSIIREIDEEVRKERMEQLWKRHGRKAMALSVVLVLGAAGFAMWQDRQTTRFERATAALAELLQTSTPDNGPEIQGKLDELARTSPAGQELVARLYASGFVKDEAQRNAAITQLDTLANTASLKPLYRDLAKLLSVQLQVGTGDAAVLKQALAPLAADGQPWRHSARELSALLSLETGDTAAAKATLEKIVSDAEAPKGVKDRAAKLLSTLG